MILGPAASAVEYPWVTPSNTQVFVVRDPYVSFALSTAATDRAQKSIDLITYMQDTTKNIGMPSLQSFRRAQARGLEGRYLFTSIPSILGDPMNRAVSMLADRNLKKPGQVVVFGGLLNLLHRLSPFYMIHEKIFIIDSGTPNELIWIRGCNNNENAEHDIDTTIILRRIDPAKPYLGDQIRDVFDSAWNSAKTVNRPKSPAFGWLAPKPDFNATVPLSAPEQKKLFDELNHVLSNPADAQQPMLPYEARPESMRALSNDFIARAMTGSFPLDYETRSQVIASEIHDAMAEEIAKAKVVYFTIMAARISKPIKEAIKTALHNGAEVHLLTNGLDAHATRTPMGLPYFLAVDDLPELMAMGGNLSVYVLDLKLAQQNPRYAKAIKFMHRKLLVTDNVAFFGSDNGNEISRTHTSELAIQVRDPRLASLFVDTIRSDLEVFSTASCEELLKERAMYSLFKRGAIRVLLPLL